MTSLGPRLLILGCSRRKRREPGPLPTVELYDGPAFRLYRRFLRTRRQPVPELLVLSAEFGLVAGDRLIPWYDRRMTSKRAQELRPGVSAELDARFGARQVTELFVSAGQEYLAVLGGQEALSKLATSTHIAQGTIGRRLAALHDWLYGTDPAENSAVTPSPPNSLVLRGVPIVEDAGEALVAARRGLVEDRAGAGRYQIWYVLVDGKRVAPKWLVSRLTGLPVERFHSQEARSAMTRLGLEVRREA